MRPRVFCTTSAGEENIVALVEEHLGDRIDRIIHRTRQPGNAIFRSRVDEQDGPHRTLNVIAQTVLDSVTVFITNESKQLVLVISRSLIKGPCIVCSIGFDGSLYISRQIRG